MGTIEKMTQTILFFKSGWRPIDSYTTGEWIQIGFYIALLIGIIYLMITRGTWKSDGNDSDTDVFGGSGDYDGFDGFD